MASFRWSLNCCFFLVWKLTSSAALFQLSFHKIILKVLPVIKHKLRVPTTDLSRESKGLRISSNVNWKLQFSVLLTYNAQFGNKHQGHRNGQAEDVVTHQVTDGPDPLFTCSPKNARCDTLYRSNTVHISCVSVLTFENGLLQKAPSQHGISRMQKCTYDGGFCNTLNNLSVI